jgi:hypothetical protein
MISVLSYDVVEAQIHTDTNNDSDKRILCKGAYSATRRYPSLGKGQTHGQKSECDGKYVRGHRVFDFRKQLDASCTHKEADVEGVRDKRHGAILIVDKRITACE